MHFAGYKYHIGFYPGASGISTFAKELFVYKGAKGSVQFPLDQPLPAALITKIVTFRVKQNEEKVKVKNLKAELKPKEDFLSLIAAPVRSALENNGIKTLKQFSSHTEADVLELHGMGPQPCLR